MIHISLFFKIAALVCWLLAAVGVSSRVNLVAAGLFLWFVTSMVLL